jgi:hypothetical protein
MVLIVRPLGTIVPNVWRILTQIPKKSSMLSPLAPEPRIHPVLVTVIKNKNGSRFLANHLINLQKVDTFANILPFS